jgi:penicillin-binding protein 2
MNRYRTLQIAVLVLSGILLIKLFSIQVVDDSYCRYAFNNVLQRNVQYPPRGEVYDRRGEYLVKNKEAYDLMVIPLEVKEFDTLELCRLIGVDKERFVKELKKARSYSRRRPSVIFKQLPKEFKLRFEARNFKGFYLTLW